MENLELLAFKIISSVGTARSMFIEAIQKAKEKQFAEAYQMIENGIQLFNEGHRAHHDLLTMDTNGELSSIPLLIIHAEDLLMSTETSKIFALELISIYERCE